MGKELVLTGLQQEQCYDNIRISKNAWDSNLLKVRHLTITKGQSVACWLDEGG